MYSSVANPDKIHKFKDLMLLPHLAKLNSLKIVLGSQSKARNELLQHQGLVYERIPSTFAEDLDKKAFPGAKQYNQATCNGKVEELLERFDKSGKEWDILICCDTILDFNGEVIEKPENPKHCVEMMGSLSGKWHKVFSAHQVVFNTKPKRLRYEWVVEAEVLFGQIPIQSLEAYAQTDRPYSHSGGYELFGMSGSFIEALKGSVSSVQGIDTYELSKYIAKGLKEANWV